MKPNTDSNLPVIIIVILLLVFGIATVIFFSRSSAQSKSNTTPNITQDIYSENNSSSYNRTIVEKEETKLSKYSTNIYDKDKNRIYNIKLACNRLNEHRIEVGDEFSFNSLLGNMGEAEGYKKALGFDSNGDKIKVFGGGICQISSTLYNAALNGKLKITERHAHSRRVYYVPKGRDATVFAGGPDLKFINNTKYPIIIYATTDGYKVKITLKQEKLTEKQTSLTN